MRKKTEASTELCKRSETSPFRQKGGLMNYYATVIYGRHLFQDRGNKLVLQAERYPSTEQP